MPLVGGRIDQGKNAASFPRRDLQGIGADPIAPFLPYRGGHDDAGLVARYEALADLRPDTFRRAFWEHFKRNEFAVGSREDPCLPSGTQVSVRPAGDIRRFDSGAA